ncbi:hypothetical protein, partial [Bacillus pseudomycoides]|uniref:hypothetical protein n=1 Tax=Bacillus pseudomycoides TaxID=64104 RepID=UPI0028526080
IKGKIDREVLKKTNINKRELNDSYAAPRDQVALKMVKLGEEILQRKNIAICDNYFELGGQSLEDIELLSTFKEHVD